MSIVRMITAICAAMCLLISVAASATPIDEKYALLGGASGFLGAPNGNELSSFDGVGKYRHFAGGSIYWHPGTGAHVVHGLIRQRWNELGSLQGHLGYPMSDEINTFDRSGRVSKFQGGELIWRSTTNSVSEVKSTDLIVDWPFPAGQAWKITQANAPAGGGSHGGAWVYCWDIILAGKSQPASKGQPFVAAADGRLVHVVEKFSSGRESNGNVIIQQLGAGRYASYLHINQNSHARRFAAARRGLPQDLPWHDRPVVKSGTVLAEVGDTGTNVGAFHLHFCVTTKPDRKEFAPFESVPIAFRNYSFSLNEGKTWTFVAVGVPKQGQWIRREARPGPSAPLINAAALVLNFGVVKGQISLSVAPPGVAGGKLTLKVESQWGEPLAQQAIAVPGGSAGPWTYEFANVPAFNNMKVSVSSEGAWNTNGGVAGEKGPFELKSGTVATVNIQLEIIKPE